MRAISSSSRFSGKNVVARHEQRLVMREKDLSQKEEALAHHHEGDSNPLV